jgi:oligopeptide/dipeptide ABC transporter ATP-binding protein
MVPHPILQVRGLSVTYGGPGALVRAVEGVDLCVRQGEVLGLVGESGSGKSTVASAVLGMLPRTASVTGTVSIVGQDMLHLSAWERRRIRGNVLTLVPQDPMTSLNPVLTVGYQLIETIRAHSRVGKRDAAERAVEALRQVGIPDPRRALRRYPHEFSGGARQRILIAAALINAPELVIADEPTSALDATVQRQVIEVLGELVRNGRMAMLLISHDLGVVASLADRICVMYAGQLVEEGRTEGILERPRHPYTAALLAAARGEAIALGRFDADARSLATCRLLPRCPIAVEVCQHDPPDLLAVGEQRFARCFVAQGVGGTTRSAV